MTATKEFPYFVAGAYDPNAACNQISELVRMGADARRLHVPIRCLAHTVDLDAKTDEVERILLLWDDPAFALQADRAVALLDEVDDYFSEGHGIDMMQLGEIRVPLNALGEAIRRRRDELTRAPAPTAG